MPEKKTIVKALYFAGQTISSLAMIRLAFTPAGAALLILYVMTQTAQDVWNHHHKLEESLNKENDDV